MKTVAENLVRRFGYTDGDLSILTDDAFLPLAEAVREARGNAEVFGLENAAEVFRAVKGQRVLLLAEPQSYLRHRLFELLSFDDGEPRVPGANSRVMIFPLDALCSILRVQPEADFSERDRLLQTLRPHTRYRITSPAGTDLSFEAREWLPLDLEICTAPVEASVNGRIVADGALFFKKLCEPLTFVIENGKLTDITAETDAGRMTMDEYRRMSENYMKDYVNRQLAEIGIGFCHGAEISDCFMEAEAAKNTCHFCFGNNICYGGENKSDFHGASILIRDPEFKIM